MKKLLFMGVACLLMWLFLMTTINTVYIVGLDQKPMKTEQRVKQLEKEITSIRNIDHTGQENSSDTQYQLDQLSRHIYDLNVGKISQAEFAKRVEAIEPRSELREIEKHELKWEKE